MNWFHGRKGWFVFIYLVGIVSLTALTRVASQFYAIRKPSQHVPTYAAKRMDRALKRLRQGLELLHSSDPTARAIGASRLGALGRVATSATRSLTDALYDPDRSVRAISAQSLGRIGSSAYPAIPALIHSLKDSDSKVRFRAIEALGKMGYAAQSAVPALIKIRNTTTGDECAAAVTALKQIMSSTNTNLSISSRSRSVVPSPIQPLRQPSKQQSIHWAELNKTRL